jgi:hypothetical protein
VLLPGRRVNRSARCTRQKDKSEIERDLVARGAELFNRGAETLTFGPSSHTGGGGRAALKIHGRRSLKICKESAPRRASGWVGGTLCIAK